MKRIFTLVALLFCGFTFGFGQSGIYGGDFEHWKQKPIYQYFEPDSSYFSTLNQLDTVVAMQPMVTVYRCDTAHSGTYSAKTITRYFSLMDIIIPGVIGTIKIDWVWNKAILGMPYPYGDSIPQVFSGYYQSYPVGNDSSAAVILLSKWNTASHKRDTLAFNYMAFHGTVNAWTYFETPISYFDPMTKPDSLTILLLSCGGFNALNMFGSQGQIGSMALFDDVSLTGFVGVGLRQLLIPSMMVRLSPNPASSFLNVELGSDIKDGYFEVYNAQAQLIKQYLITGKYCQINVGDLSAGTYYYKLTSNSKLLNSGTFIVTK